jgi:hypothetical protein
VGVRVDIAVKGRRVMHRQYLHFALKIRAIVDPLIELIDKPNHPYECDVKPLKDELVKALEILSAAESKALRNARG